jgi:Cu/Ag efflux pump CusA
MALAKGALRAMLLRRMRAIVFAAAIVTVLVCSVAWVTQQTRGEKTGEGGADSVRWKPATFPIVVTAEYAGASPQEVERQVTIPLEIALAGIRGMEGTRSRSLFGLACVRMEFGKGTDRLKPREAISNRLKVLKGLPPGVLPMVGVTTPADDCLRYILVGPTDADGHDLYTLNDLHGLQDSVLERNFRRVQGVADVESLGGTESATRFIPTRIG